MGRLEKLKARIMKRPTASDITATELQNLLQAYGFVLKRVNGDHYIYGHPKIEKPIPPIPMSKIIKPAYIDLIRRFLIEIED